GMGPPGIGRDRLQEDGQRKHRADGDTAHERAGGDDDPTITALHVLLPVPCSRPALDDPAPSHPRTPGVSPARQPSGGKFARRSSYSKRPPKMEVHFRGSVNVLLRKFVAARGQAPMFGRGLPTLLLVEAVFPSGSWP